MRKVEPPEKPPEDPGVSETLAAPQALGEPILLHPVDAAHYELKREIARGGLGRIRIAVDKRLDREVAIKELLDATADHAARFAREALVTARLAHPAIVPVYEAGLWPDGSPFFAMKLVAGRSLEAVVRERATLAERLALLPHVIDVAEALAFAHDRRIIHRDLKPANVLIGDFGETVVIDWGLAKDLTSREADLAPAPTYRITDGQTVVGAVMGTPAYMPPEQAYGSPVDERADVYALGALLYHVLAGEPPYQGTSSQDIILQVIKDPPPALTTREAGVPADLLAIVNKAMARDPDERYPTARELAEDLNKFQQGKLVAAHAYSIAQRLVRWLRRHRAPVLVAAAMLAVLAAGAVLSVARIVKERDVARAQRAEMARLKEAADEKGDLLALREAEAELPHDPRRALAWLKQLSPACPRWGAARVLAADAMARGAPRAVLPAEGARIVRFAPDGKLLAEARDADVIVRDLKTGQTAVLGGRGGDVRALAWSPDGGRLAYGGERGVVRIWDRRVQATTDHRGHSGEVRRLGFSADGRLASAAADGIRLWSAEGGGDSHALDQGDVTELAWAPGGARLAWIADGKARVWTGQTVASLGPAALVAWAPDEKGALLVVAHDGGAARVAIDTRQRSVLAALPAPPTTAAAAADASLIAVGDEAGGVTLVSTRRGAWRVAVHDGAVTALAVAPDGSRVVSSGRDRAVRVLTADGGAGRELRGHEAEVTALAVAPDTDTLAMTTRDGALRLWNLAAGETRALAGAAAAGTRQVATAPGGAVAVAGEGGVWLWRGEAAPVVRAVEVATRAMAFAPDGGTLFALGDDGAVRAVTVATGAATKVGGAPGASLLAVGLRELAVGDAQRVTVLDGRGGGRPVLEGRRASLAWSPGGTLLAAGGAEGAFLLRLDGKAPERLDESPAAQVAFSGDGHWIAAAGPSGVTVFRVATGARRVIDGAGAAAAVLFSPDSKRVAAVGEDHAVRVWDISGGPARVVIPGAATAVFSPDGGELAIVGSDGSARVVDAGSGTARPLAITEARAAAFAADGSAVLVATAAGAVRVFPETAPVEPEALRRFLAGVTDAEVGK